MLDADNAGQIYFCNFIIDPALKDPVHSKYIDTTVLDKYWDVGGVRYVIARAKTSEGESS